LALLVATMPAAAAGPLRAIFAIGLPRAFVIGGALTALAVAFFARSLRPRAPSAEAVAQNAVVAVLAIVALYWVYARAFDGLECIRGPDGHLSADAGFHMTTYHHFVNAAPNAYSGFVSLYGVWNAIERVTGDLTTAARVTWVLGVIVVAVVPAMIAFAASAGLERRARIAGGVTCLVAGLVVQRWLVLPLEAFHHGSGFWPHVFALVPLFCLWLADAVVQPPLSRVAALCVAAILYRFSYGLNLPDLLATLALVLALEALGRLRRPLRAAFAVAAIAVAVAAAQAYAVLRPVLDRPGWIVDNDLALVFRGEAWGLAALVCALAWPRDGEPGGTLARSLRVPILFTASNLFFMYAIERHPPSTDYYVDKHSFHAVVLLASAFVVLASLVAARLARRLAWRAVVVAVGCAALVAVSQLRLRAGFASYQPMFAELLAGRPPFQYLNPWVDPEAVARIRRVLAQSPGKKFGGYLAPFWPMTIFTNSLYDIGDKIFWARPHAEPARGTCVFWEGHHEPDLDVSANKKCVTYYERWSEPGTRREFCWRCD
jgi:hypothetical protein